MTFNFENVKNDFDRRMQGAVEVLRQEFSGLRSGRANTALLDPITVEAYGSPMPLNQIATINIPEPRALSIQVWDSNLVKAAEKAILDSGLGLNPSTEGQIIRIAIPSLTEERRQELTKVAAKYAEDARIAIRNIRRHSMDQLKKNEKDGNISKDALHEYSEEVQRVTDKFINLVDEALSNKNREITQV